MIDVRERPLRPLPSHRADLEGVLLDEEEIDLQVRRMAAEIRRECPGWHCVIVLNGAIFFAADLLRLLPDCTYDTIQVSSYVGQSSNGKPQIRKALSKPVKGRKVLIIEDIVDTGQTVRFLLDHLRRSGARDIKVASLLSKPDCQKVKVTIDFLGFLVPQRFLVGYGLDCEEKHRTLPFLCVVR